MQLIEFATALAQTEDVKRHLLMGNGYSMGVFPNRFSYGSLIDSVDFTAYRQARLAFGSLQTTNFEIVIHPLPQAFILLPLYGSGTTRRI
jgi:Domain of unknown function (DUF4917)